MLRKDFLVKQLEEFGKVMAVILGAKRQKDWDHFEKEIGEATLKFTALNSDYVENLDLPDFEKEILNHPTLDLDQKMILADLLFEKMNFYLEKNDQVDYLQLKTKCISLYKHVQNNFTQNEFNLNVYYKLEFLNKQ